MRLKEKPCQSLEHTENMNTPTVNKEIKLWRPPETLRVLKPSRKLEFLKHRWGEGEGRTPGEVVWQWTGLTQPSSRRHTVHSISAISGRVCDGTSDVSKVCTLASCCCIVVDVLPCVSWFFCSWFACTCQVDDESVVSEPGQKNRFWPWRGLQVHS